jgi:hypothetical protein
MNAFFSSWYDLKRRLPNSEESASLALLAGVDEDVVRRWFSEGSENRTESRTVIGDRATQRWDWSVDVLDPMLDADQIDESSMVMEKLLR